MLLKKTYTITWNLDPSNAGNSSGRDYIPSLSPRANCPIRASRCRCRAPAPSHFGRGQRRGAASSPTATSPSRSSPRSRFCRSATRRSWQGRRGTLRPTSAPTSGRRSHRPGSPVLKKIAAEVKGKNSVETVRNILAWMRRTSNTNRKTDMSSSISRAWMRSSSAAMRSAGATRCCSRPCAGRPGCRPGRSGACCSCRAASRAKLGRGLHRRRRLGAGGPAEAGDVRLAAD